MKGEIKIGWNKDWMKTVTKQQFIDNHKEAFPDVDLSAEYDKVVEKQTKIAKEDK